MVDVKRKLIKIFNKTLRFKKENNLKLKKTRYNRFQMMFNSLTSKSKITKPMKSIIKLNINQTRVEKQQV